jgi:EAL domain-containing protein (putative c-di-GMP-specific phosphodiesterase class I)
MAVWDATIVGGHAMGIRTVADYGEDQATLGVVRALGIDFAQGYAVGRLHRLQGTRLRH